MFDYHYCRPQLLQLSPRCLSLCDLRGFLNRELPGVFALFIDIDLKSFFVHFLHLVASALELNLLWTPLLAVEEFSMEVEHDVFGDLLHILVDVLVQQRVFFQLVAHVFVEVLEKLT